MPQIPSHIFDIAQKLKNNEQPKRRASVKTLLKWFGAVRRRPNVVSEIQDALRAAGLKTEPDFTEVKNVDELLRFVLISDADQSVPPATPNPVDGGAVSTDMPAAEFAASFSTNSDGIADDSIEPEDEGPSPGQADDRPVVSQPYDWTISALRDKRDRGLLNLQPHFQREYVWDLKPELRSRLIESVLLEIPIPPIYFGKLPDGMFEVIDGQQRLTTLIDFINNKFALQKKGVMRMPSLETKHFRDLPKDHKEKILDAPIRTVVIDAGGNPNLRYEIFDRLNRGSMALNEQELRNCVYRGPFNDLLAELERDSAWRRVKSGASPEPRFKEREMILRFFAFANRLSFYKGNLKGFLNEYMGSYAPRDADQLKEQGMLFRQTMQNILTVFGDDSARLYNFRKGSNNGEWDTKFSIAALEIQAGALLDQSPAKVQVAADQIREYFVFFLLNDESIKRAIATHTSGSDETKRRWTAFKSVIQPILDGTTVEPRFFGFEFRKELYDAKPFCELCKNQIRSFEDCTVDHIVPYRRGGKTTRGNGQLAHRWCNARKNVQIPPTVAIAG